jgi:NADH-quinone oxidoreductase subunit G
MRSWLLATRTSTVSTASFLCVKGRFAQSVREHGSAHSHADDSVQERRQADSRRPGTKRFVTSPNGSTVLPTSDGRNSIGVVGSPRLTNEALHVLHKFATDLVGTENYTVTGSLSVSRLSSTTSARRSDTSRHSLRRNGVLLIGGEPEELQPLTGKQIGKL